MNIESNPMAVTPERARAHLEHLGYTEDTWDEVMKENYASHNVRAYISIVRGGGPKITRRSLYGRAHKRWSNTHAK